MELIDTVGPIKTEKDQLNGIFNYIKKKIGVNDLESTGIVTLSSSGTSYGKLKNIISWDGVAWASTFSSDSWFEITFPNHFVLPHSYSMGAPYFCTETGTGSYYYQKEWKVYGYNDWDDENQWTLIGDHDNSNGFCKNAGTSCREDTTTTFYLQRNNKWFKHIRWVLVTPSYFRGPRMTTGGIEIYGALSKTPFDVMCYCSCNRRTGFSSCFCTIFILDHFKSH